MQYKFFFFFLIILFRKKKKKELQLRSMEFVDYNSIIVKHFLLSCVLHGLTARSL